MATGFPPVVLFGYDSSPFTHKIRLALRVKQIPYTFVVVPSMMPRPVLRDSFHLTYRKIPVLAIGREVYCDTSLITETLEHTFSNGHPSLYPCTADGRDYRSLIRGFASYWTDRPLFRVATGLIPGSVWRTTFGADRSALIGHKLDADKLEAKLPRNLVSLDLQLSLLTPLFTQLNQSQGSPYIFSTSTPSLADISLFYQLEWGLHISAGRGIYNLTGGGIADTNTTGAAAVLNAERYPGICAWMSAVREFMDSLPSTETMTTDAYTAIETLKAWNPPSAMSQPEAALLPTPQPALIKLEEKSGLFLGAEVSVAPDDTGRDDPTLGTLLALSPEEVIIKPAKLESIGEALVDVRVHFPRLGFVVKPLNGKNGVALAKM